jgi:hypothetical protein
MSMTVGTDYFALNYLCFKCFQRHIVNTGTYSETFRPPNVVEIHDVVRIVDSTIRTGG